MIIQRALLQEAPLSPLLAYASLCSCLCGRGLWNLMVGNVLEVYSVWLSFPSLIIEPKVMDLKEEAWGH